jgi:hypothetical protein
MRPLTGDQSEIKFHEFSSLWVSSTTTIPIDQRCSLPPKAESKNGWLTIHFRTRQVIDALDNVSQKQAM